MNPKVSIIVPVYNAEHYIRRCIDSILNQEYTNFELIVVNDGSKDSSGQICEEYAKKDPRVVVIHKENTGVSDTRNVAIDQARGAYLQFLDSDDWITPNATKLLVSRAEENNCDMVVADFYRVVGKRVSAKGDIDEGGLLTKEEFASHMMENPADFYYGVLWNKLYKREIIDTHQLRMNTDIDWCEDFMFNLEYMRFAERYYILQTPIYYYVKTKGSLVSQGFSIANTVKMKLMVFEYYNNFYKHIFEEEEYEKNRLQVYRFLIDAAGDGMVAPRILPSSKKLGEERCNAITEVIIKEGILLEEYRNRKLLEYYLEPVANENNMTVDELKVLRYIDSYPQINRRKDLADIANLSLATLTFVLQKLAMKNMIKLNKQDEKVQFFVLSEAKPILSQIKRAEQEVEQAKCAGFSEKEVECYKRMTEKIKGNMERILR